MPRPTLPILVLLIAACGGDRPEQALPARQRATSHAPGSTSGSAPLLLRGIVKLSPSLQFQSCEAGPLMGVLDSTGDRIVSTYRFMRATEQEGMYVLARGGATAQGQIVFRELEFAGRPDEGRGCGELMDYLVMVRGTDPEWGLKLTGPTLLFSGAGQPAPIEFPAPAPDDSGGFKRYQTTSDNGTHTLHLLLIRASCSEGRTGMYSAISAAVILDGRRLQGCGWRGRLP
ncbi:MAG TPA: hypothetical protein VGP61_02250 [Gemmatimonadales bacterium]|nr:hypothetical protein [Gemmatimonadales bacterium]